LCVVKDFTLAGNSKRSIREHLPMIVNDPHDEFAVLTALQESYEGKTIPKADEKIKPSSSIALTMDEGLTCAFRAK
jgi:hypothetical protein